jgi:hypothetical protein
MGRKKTYYTKEELMQANREKVMRYYWKNSNKIKKINLNRYYETKQTKNHD